MASKLPVWGIDVGQCALKAVKLQSADQQVEMLAFDLVEHEINLSQAGTEAPELIKKAIQTFLSRNNLRDSQVVVAVPGQQTLTRFTKMPPVEPKKIPDMVQYEASQQIPFDMDEVVWDYQVFMEKDSPDVEVGIFAIRKELIRNYLMQFTEARIEPMIVQSSPMASYNAARFEHTDDDGKACILLDMGALATDLIVMEGKRIWSRPIPIGGNRFTEALVSAFKIAFPKAERLKRNAAASKHARQIFQALRPVLADLVSEIQRSIGFYTSTHRDAHIARVIGMGNAFKLPGLQKYLQQNLQLEVERLSMFNRLVAGAERGPEFAENVMSFSVAYGLALQGLGLSAVNSNLLPLEVRRTLLWRKKQPWFAAGAAALALSAVALWAGNVRAGGQIDNALGGVTNIAPRSVASDAEAERIIAGTAGGAGGSPLEKAAQLVGAAERLKQEFSKVSSTSVGDVGSLGAMTKLLENNVFVPRILDIIHRGFEEAAPPELRQATTNDQYRQLARTIKREERGEICIRMLSMIYDEKDPADLFEQRMPRADLTGLGRGPGWLVELRAETTQRQGEEFANWLVERLIKPLEKLGRVPGRGLYVDKVFLAEVYARQKDAAVEVDTGPVDGPTRGATGDSGGAGPRTRAGGRRPGQGGITPSGPREPGAGTRTGRTPSVSPSGRTPDGAQKDDLSTDPIERLRQRFTEFDPLTDEKMSEDQGFRLFIVVRKGDTPKNLLPDEHKSPDQKGAPPTAEESAPPPEEERRDE